VSSLASSWWASPFWERRDGNGRTVTFPGRPLIVHGDKRSFELLRANGKAPCSTQLSNPSDLIVRPRLTRGGRELANRRA
jgi:hypothetical protein